jgi:hypothetical protein
MIHVPVFRYGPGDTIVRLSLPARPWNERVRTIGGYEKIDSGARESWTQRRDRILALPLRFDEAERPAVDLMIEWLQDFAGGPADVWLSEDDFDAALDPISFLLESPMQGTDFAPARATEPGIFEATIEITREDGAAWSIPYFAPVEV